MGVQEIVDKAGISKPTLYYYFGSKLGLLQNLLETGYQEFESRLIDIARPGESLPGVLYQAARTFFDYAASNQKFYLFMLSLFYSGRENEAYKTVSPLIERYYKIIVKIFEDASPIGEHAGAAGIICRGVYRCAQPSYYDSELRAIRRGKI